MLLVFFVFHTSSLAFSPLVTKKKHFKCFEKFYNFKFVVPVKKKGLTSILLTSFQNSSSAQTASSSQPVNFIGKDRISFYSSKPRTNNFYTGNFPFILFSWSSFKKKSSLFLFPYIYITLMLPFMSFCMTFLFLAFPSFRCIDFLISFLYVSLYPQKCRFSFQDVTGSMKFRLPFVPLNTFIKFRMSAYNVLSCWSLISCWIIYLSSYRVTVKC